MREVGEVTSFETWKALRASFAQEELQVEDEIARSYAEAEIEFVEALCRHFPGIAPAIRQVACHLLEDVRHVGDPTCCREPWIGPTGADRQP